MKRPKRRQQPLARGFAAWIVLFVLAADAAPSLAQRLEPNYGIDITGTVSSNPDLAPKGEERSDAWVDFSPWFSLKGTLGNRFSISGSGRLGASLRLSVREGATYSTNLNLRPSGAVNGTWEIIDNFFYVDVNAGVQSSLDNPFLATTDPSSPVNTSSSYQVGIAPYVRGRLPGNFTYEVRSANYWTDDWTGSRNYAGQYSATNTVRVDRAPQPLGGVFIYQQQLLSSDVADQSLLKTETARISLRYALTSQLALGARIGAERYNYTIAANDWQRFYGAELGWRPNERTNLEGYWEDRVFGNSWQLAFTYRRPLVAFNIRSSRILTSTPQQFLTFPGLSSLASLLNEAFTTRIPDPIERQRAVVDFLSRTQLPAELLTPTIIYTQNFTIEERTIASVVLYGQRNSVGFTLFSTITDTSAGIVAELPLASKIRERGAELSFSRQMSPITSLTATATYRNTDDLLDIGAETTQKKLQLEFARSIGRRTDGRLGARYQWIDSTVTNDATEAAVYFILQHRLNEW